TGNRKVILDSEKISLKVHSSFFEGGATASGQLSGSVTKLPIVIDGDVNPLALQAYSNKIKGMRGFNKILQRWMYWDGLNWVSDSFSTFSLNSIIVNNPVGGILDTGSTSNTG